MRRLLHLQYLYLVTHTSKTMSIESFILKNINFEVIRVHAVRKGKACSLEKNSFHLGTPVGGHDVLEV